MAKQTINVGTTANDRKGDSLRAAFQKVNANFTELYTALGLDTAPLNLGAFEFSGSTLSTTDSSAITIDQATTVTSDLTVGGDILPSVANGGDLGSAANPWRSLYVSGSTIYIGGNALSINDQGELTYNDNRVAHEAGEFMTLDNLSDLNVNSPNAGDTIAWMGSHWVNVPLYEDRLHSEGDEVVLVGGANPYVTFPAITGGDQLIIQGAEISSVAGSLALTSQDNLNIIANGSGAAPGGSKSWTFSADGSLTIPGDIRSEQAINIDINLSDSTLRRWTFGEDGNLTLPNGGDIVDSNGNSVLGGGGASTGDITFAATTLTAPNDDEIFIAAKTAERDRAKLRLNPVDGDAYLEVWSYEGTRSDSSWATGVWELNIYGNPTIQFTGAFDLADWVVGTLQSGVDADTVSYSINGGPYIQWNGGSSADPVTGFVDISTGTAPPANPTTITSIDWKYAYKSRIGTSYGNQRVEIRTQGQDLDINIGGGVQLYSTGTMNISNSNSSNSADINIYSGDDILIQGKNKTTSDSEGGDINIRAGKGGDADDNDSAGGGGDIDIRAGAGGDFSPLYNPGFGGTATLRAGDGGLASVTYNKTARPGGTLSLYAGSAGYNDGDPSLGSYGANVTIQAGNSNSQSDNGGSIILSPGTNGYGPSTLAGNVEISIPSSSGAAGGSWIFGGDGRTLTIPGDIRSEQAINIDINLSDSTLRRWTFGEDGDLTFPDGTTQTTAWVDGGSSIVNTTSLSVNDFSTGTYDNKGSVEVTYTPYTGASSGFNFSAEFQSPLDGTKGVTVGAVSTPLIHNDNGINIEINLVDSTKRIWKFEEDGNLTLPGGADLITGNYDVGLRAGNDGASTFGTVTINTQAPAPTYTVTQEGGFVGGPGANNITGNISNSPAVSSIVVGMVVTGANLVGVTTVTDVSIGPGGDFTITTNADEVDPFDYNAVYTFTTASGLTNRIWDFNSLGELTLPQGGAIQETTVTNELWGTTTTSLTLVPGGAANGTQRLEIYSTGGGEGDHIHITSGDQNQTDLFLGNDTQYFAVGAMGQMEIRARKGLDSPSPGTGAESGSPVWIYAGDAGDNGGNTVDGAPGGDVFISSGISTSGLGGDILLNTSSGPDGFGSIRMSTNGGSAHLEFKKGNVLQIPGGVHEQFQTKADATGVVTHDCSLGHIFYHTSPDANWTVNLTNLNLDSGHATAVTLVIVQGGTGYYPSAVQIGGAAQTLNWQGNATPTPSTNRTDVVTLSIINNSGTYTVLGQLTGF